MENAVIGGVNKEIYTYQTSVNVTCAVGHELPDSATQLQLTCSDKTTSWAEHVICTREKQLISLILFNFNLFLPNKYEIFTQGWFSVGSAS